MHRVQNRESLPPHLKGGAYAIGNFDGLHRGHRKVLGDMVRRAEETGIDTVGIVTFEPHPRTYFNPDGNVFRLTPPLMKQALAKALGLDVYLELTFDDRLASLTAEAFIQHVLVGDLGARLVVTGEDFHFGKGRSGNRETLESEGRKLGFEALGVAAYGRDHDPPISSSAIRAALSDGDIETANSLLGYRWTVRSTIDHGEKRGRELGYPTANMRLEAGCQLAHGVYAVRMRIAGGVHNGVASYGRRPQFDNGAPLLETYLFDFSGDLYGQTAEVEFVSFLRFEQRFESVEDLVLQMDRDSDGARKELAAIASDPFGPDSLSKESLRES